MSRKLGIATGARVAIVRAPEGFAKALEPLPEGVRLRTQARATQDVLLFFATRASELDRRFDALARAVAPGGELWIAWPKRTANVATDLREGLVREIGATHGLIDTKACAVDDTWSGMRFVSRARHDARRATA